MATCSRRFCRSCRRFPRWVSCVARARLWRVARPARGDLARSRRKLSQVTQTGRFRTLVPLGWARRAIIAGNRRSSEARASHCGRQSAGDRWINRWPERHDKQGSHEYRNRRDRSRAGGDGSVGGERACHEARPDVVGGGDHDPGARVEDAPRRADHDRDRAAVHGCDRAAGHDSETDAQPASLEGERSCPRPEGESRGFPCPASEGRSRNSCAPGEGRTGTITRQCTPPRVRGASACAGSAPAPDHAAAVSVGGAPAPDHAGAATAATATAGEPVVRRLRLSEEAGSPAVQRPRTRGSDGSTR